MPIYLLAQRQAAPVVTTRAYPGLPLLIRLKPGQSLGARHRLRTPGYPELGVDSPRVSLDRMQRNKQLLGDLLVRTSLGDETQDRELAVAQADFIA